MVWPGTPLKTIPHHYIRRISWWGRRSGGTTVVPALELNDDDIQIELDRRRPGQSRLVTQRQEADRAEIFSGYIRGSHGSPIGMLVRMRMLVLAPRRHENHPRPSHADWTTEAKYGFGTGRRRSSVSSQNNRACRRRRYHSEANQSSLV